MKKPFLVSLLAFALALSACSVAPAPGGIDEEPQTAAEDPTEEPTEVPPTATPEPTDEPTEVPPTPTPEPTPTPTPEPLLVGIVIEDQASGRASFTSSDEIADSLAALGIDFEVISLYDDGAPTLGRLEQYGAVFWAVGDDCCDTPRRQSIELIEDYVRGGGGLFLEGASVVFPWANQPFLTNFVGANWLGFSPLGDVVVEAEDHPLAQGFGVDAIDLNVNGRIEPDTIEPTGDTVAVFTRGPNSAERGRAAIIATEAGQDGKLIISAVPLQWFFEDDRELLIQNALDWFTQ